MGNFLKNWWEGLKYEPNDPRRLAGGNIKIAVIGGGTGLSVLLRGLKRYSSEISAIVTVTDDGRSSGRISEEFDILPPGDIRKCISALAYDEKLLAEIMEYRFSKDKKSFGGHTLGNIWLTALSKYFGSFERAVEATTEIFETAGRVLPATLKKVRLCAEYADGGVAIGESKIPCPGKKIKKVYLESKNIRPYKNSVLAIGEADLIVLGPGSLYTSVMPNLLIKGIVDAVKKNVNAMKVFVCNSSTERGETENMTVPNHIKAIQIHAGKRIFNHVIVNNNIVKKTNKVSELGSINNITTVEKEILGCKVALADVISAKNPLYHDSDKLAKAIIELYNRTKRK